MLCKLHLRGSSRKALLQQPSLVLSGSDAPAAPLSSRGEGRELHRAPPIREPGCYSAPRLALWVNNLYPEILRPPPPHPPFLTIFSALFSYCFLCFHPPLAVLSAATSAPPPPSYPQRPVKTSCHYVCQQACYSVRQPQPHDDR